MVYLEEIFQYICENSFVVIWYFVFKVVIFFFNNFLFVLEKGRNWLFYFLFLEVLDFFNNSIGYFQFENFIENYFFYVDLCNNLVVDVLMNMMLYLMEICVIIIDL